MNTSSDDDIKFSWPSALDINSYYDLIERLIEDLSKILSKEKRARYEPIKRIYDIFTVIHTDYVNLLVNFRDAVLDAQLATRRIHHSFSNENDPSADIILAAAKNEFLSQRKLRKNDRGEVKSFAGSRLDNAIDTYERNFLYQLLWYFQYEASVDNHGKKPERKGYDLYLDDIGKDKDPLQRWDTLSSSIAIAINDINSPEKVIDEIDKAQIASDSRRGLVDAAFLELQIGWGMLPK